MNKIRHSPLIPFTREERQTIVENMTYQEVNALARQYMGRGTSDKNLFLAQATIYHAMKYRLELDIKNGLDDRNMPAPPRAAARNGAQYVRGMKRVIRKMARNLVEKGRGQ